jgi:KUP system potassium uptake protein
MSMSIVLPASDSGRSEAVETGAARSRSRFWALTLGSAGVVYGDIGTSPLYAFRAAILAAAPDGAVTRGTVIGVLSLIMWALIIIVTLKYVMVLLRADNRGEGGTLALMALAQQAVGKRGGAVVLLGIVSAALFYGDAAITPALSVLSAIEGLKVVTPAFNNYVVPLTVLILVGLFAVEHRGTAAIAVFFGPITAVWFVVIGIAGAVHISADPGVLTAFNPLLAIEFFAGHGFIGLVTLGAVFLAVTGAEALYADLGHFGRLPIQTAWLGLVLPALALNYLGQGALVLADPSTIRNPFFLLFPHWAAMPMVLLATAATVIASQAVISGAYSLSRQAIHLGLMPRLEIRHTSKEHAGQVYMPQINWMLLIVVLLLVVWFGSSSALASAYGIAVNGTMVMTCLLAFIVVRKVWGWSLPATAALIVPFLLIDMGFLVANLLKVAHGGWVPLALGGVIVAAMYSWWRGNRGDLKEPGALNVS